MRKFIFIFFVFLFSGSFIRAYSEDNILKLTLYDVQRIFLKNNLTLMAKHYDVDQAQAQILQAKLLDNPVFSFNENAYNSITKRFLDFGNASEQSVDIEQEIKLAGQRNKRIIFEKINAEMAQYQYEEVIRTLYGELNRHFIDIYFDTQSDKVYDEEISSLAKLVKAFALQQSKGNVSLMEKSRLEAELMTLKKEKNSIENQLISDRQELNMFLGLPVSILIIPDINEQALANLKLRTIDYKEIDSLLTERSDLKLARANIRASVANFSLQRSLAAPAFSIKGDYDRSGGFIKNFFSVGFGISIPIFDRNQGNIKAAKYNIEQSNRESEAVIQKAHSELYSAYVQWKNAMALYCSFDTTIEQNFSKLLAGIIDNFTKRNINMLEFIDYYESYKNTYLQLCDIRKDVFLKMQLVNEEAGRTIFEY